MVLLLTLLVSRAYDPVSVLVSPLQLLCNLSTFGFSRHGQGGTDRWLRGTRAGSSTPVFRPGRGETRSRGPSCVFSRVRPQERQTRGVWLQEDPPS